MNRVITLLTLGLGQFAALAAVASPSCDVGEDPLRLLSPVTVTAGQQEPPLPSVGRSHVGRAETVPLRSVPERGQRPENFSEGIPARGSE